MKTIFIEYRQNRRYTFKSMKSTHGSSLNPVTSGLWPHAKSSLTRNRKEIRASFVFFLSLFVSHGRLNSNYTYRVIEFFAIADIAVFKSKSCFIRSKTWTWIGIGTNYNSNLNSTYIPEVGGCPESEVCRSADP